MCQNFEDAVAKVFETYNFLSGDKMFWSFTAILRRVILFPERGLTFADLTFAEKHAIFLQTPNSIFRCGAGCKENRCYYLKMASLGSTY